MSPTLSIPPQGGIYHAERLRKLTLVDAVYAFADDRLDRELIDIARDGVISEDERERFDRIVEKIRTITAAAIALASVPRGG